MLRITKNGTATQETWTLCGQLAGAWVGELRTEWVRRCTEYAGRRCLVDLSDVVFIDEAGERLLRQMREQGAEFAAVGVDTKDLLANLDTKEKRALRRFFGPCAPGCD